MEEVSTKLRHDAKRDDDRAAAKQERQQAAEFVRGNAYENEHKAHDSEDAYEAKGDEVFHG